MVIAGCNGSGKSSFSRLLAAEDFEPFDYDFHYLKYYKELFDSAIRDLMAHNLSFGELQNRIGQAIMSNANFSYETNFNYTPMHWLVI